MMGKGRIRSGKVLIWIGMLTVGYAQWGFQDGAPEEEKAWNWEPFWIGGFYLYGGSSAFVLGATPGLGMAPVSFLRGGIMLLLHYESFTGGFRQWILGPSVFLQGVPFPEGMGIVHVQGEYLWREVEIAGGYAPGGVRVRQWVPVFLVGGGIQWGGVPGIQLLVLMDVIQHPFSPYGAGGPIIRITWLGAFGRGL